MSRLASAASRKVEHSESGRAASRAEAGGRESGANPGDHLTRSRLDIVQLLLEQIEYLFGRVVVALDAENGFERVHVVMILRKHLSLSGHHQEKGAPHAFAKSPGDASRAVASTSLIKSETFVRRFLP